MLYEWYTARDLVQGASGIRFRVRFGTPPLIPRVKRGHSLVCENLETSVFHTNVVEREVGVYLPSLSRPRTNLVRHRGVSLRVVNTRLSWIRTKVLPFFLCSKCWPTFEVERPSTCLKIQSHCSPVRETTWPPSPDRSCGCRQKVPQPLESVFLLLYQDTGGPGTLTHTISFPVWSDWAVSLLGGPPES